MMRTFYEQASSDNKNKNRLKTLLLISLALHLLISLGVLRQAFRKKTTLTLNPALTKPQQQLELPAELKSRRGSLDDVTYFDFSQPQEAAQKTEQSKEQTAAKEESKPKEVLAPKEEIAKQAKHQDELEQARNEKALKEAIEAKNEAQEEKDSQKSETSAQKTPDFDLQKIALNNLLKPAQQTKGEKRPPAMRHTYTPQAQEQQKPNFGIAPGGGLEDLGFDLAVRHGDPNKKASFEDLKYIPYLRSIAKTYFNEIAFESTKNKIMPGEVAEIYFVLDKKGAVIEQHNRLQTRGTLHNILLKALHAIAPFQPIPNHFAANTIGISTNAAAGRLMMTMYVHDNK
jgi:hypothetical protein